MLELGTSGSVEPRAGTRPWPPGRKLRSRKAAKMADLPPGRSGSAPHFHSSGRSKGDGMMMTSH